MEKATRELAERWKGKRFLRLLVWSKVKGPLVVMAYYPSDPRVTWGIVAGDGT